MKPFLAAGLAITLFSIAPAFAAENDPNASTGKPGSSSNPTPGADNGNMNSSGSTSMGTAGSSAGSSAGTSGSRQMPGASDSAKPDSSLSTNGNKRKQ